MELLEQDVLEQFAAGELDAFEALFRQHQGEVYSWIVRIVRDPAAAEDLTVDTFWRIYTGHARFDPERSFGAWARRIATNVAIDYLKKTRSRARFFSTEMPAEFLGDSKPSNPAIERERRERIQLAFAQLPGKLRAVATLALIEECPHSEIATALNISVAAVKGRIFRAVRLLRNKLGNLEKNYE